MSDLRLIRYAAAFGMTALCAWGGATWAATPAAEQMIHVAAGTIIVPASSIPRAEDAGIRAHTNVRLFLPNGKIHTDNSAPSGKYETPASLACVYGLTKAVTGCNPETLKTVLNTGSKVVVIVDAFDYPTAANDLGVFSAEYGLPAVTAKNFEVVYATGTKPAQDTTGGWELEESLDIEMAHSMAPNAKVILVEAASNNNSDLYVAEKVAGQLASAAGGGEVSNSFSGGEAPGEKKQEKYYKAKGVVFLASAGDSHGIGTPAALDDVIAVGGTTILRDGNGNFVSQKAWSNTGGGSSAYILIPKFQKPVAKIVGAYRGTPDISLDADPQSGVWLYDTTPYGSRILDWTTVGGTSVSSPALAGILNSAGSFAKSTPAELTEVYKDFTNTADWTDITAGTCGNNGGATAVAGWDFCTGVGVPNGFGGK